MNAYPHTACACSLQLTNKQSKIIEVGQTVITHLAYCFMDAAQKQLFWLTKSIDQTSEKVCLKYINYIYINKLVIMYNYNNNVLLISKGMMMTLMIQAWKQVMLKFSRKKLTGDLPILIHFLSFSSYCIQITKNMLMPLCVKF